MKSQSSAAPTPLPILPERKLRPREGSELFPLGQWQNRAGVKVLIFTAAWAKPLSSSSDSTKLLAWSPRGPWDMMGPVMGDDSSEEGRGSLDRADEA